MDARISTRSPTDRAQGSKRLRQRVRRRDTKAIAISGDVFNGTKRVLPAIASGTARRAFTSV
jgi:hypothetical protein